MTFTQLVNAVMLSIQNYLGRELTDDEIDDVVAYLELFRKH